MLRFIHFFLLVSLLLLTACSASPTPVPTTSPLAGELTFAGSTTVQPLADKIGEAFIAMHPDVTLDIAAGGSEVGIQAIQDGTVDIGMVSRSLTLEETQGITPHQIAMDVIAIIVNETNTVDDLTLEQLQAIYLGEITDWSDVGGDDAPITVVIRDVNSGTRGAFDKIVLEGAEPATPNLQTALTASDVAVSVQDNHHAIGYVGFGHLDAGLKTLKIESVAPSAETAQDGSYRVTRPLQLMTGPLSQPLAEAFVAFALSETGQRVIEESGWVPAQ